MTRNIRQAGETGNGITGGVIWKQLLAFFFPILLGIFFQQLYNTVDAVVVGQFVGKEALAAVGGSTGTLINLLIGFFVGLASGATVIVSQFYGGQQEEQVSKAVHTAASLSLVVAVLFTVAGLAFSKPALRAMGTPDDIMDHATIYIQVYFAGIIFPIIYNMGSGILRAVGDSKRPLYFLIISCLVNVVLDVLLVAVFRLGVLGAALATVLSQAASAVLVLLALTKTPACYRLDRERLAMDRQILGSIIRIGCPAGLQSVMYSVSNIIIQATINGFGTNIIAAYTAYGKIDGFYWMIMSAFGVSITTFVGQNFGAQQYGRIRKSVRVCLAMAMGTAFAISAFLMVAGPYCYRLFTSDAEVIADGMSMLRQLVPFYFTYVCIEILAGAVRGAGDSFIPMIVTCLGVCVFRVAWIWVAVPLNPVIDTVLFSYPLTWSVTSVLFIVYYLQGGWLRRRIREMGFEPEVR